MASTAAMCTAFRAALRAAAEDIEPVQQAAAELKQSMVRQSIIKGSRASIRGKRAQSIASARRARLLSANGEQAGNMGGALCQVLCIAAELLVSPSPLAAHGKTTSMRARVVMRLCHMVTLANLSCAKIWRVAACRRSVRRLDAQGGNARAA